MTSGSRAISAPECCTLRHHVFSSFDAPVFRKADSDGAPVMVVQLGQQEALIPLRSLQREFAIADDSEDGRMLALIAQSLDFISILHIGDPLPAEVLTGEASWEPRAEHLQIAQARLQWQLIVWLNSGAGAETPLDAAALLRVADDPAHKSQIQEAFAKAANALGLPAGELVIQLVEELAQELAYMEALRDRLLSRVKQMTDKLNRLAQTRPGGGAHLETLIQVRRFALTALKQIGSRFSELDAQTGEIMSALRNVESQRVFIRSNRDWLYRTQRAWQALLTEWDTAGSGFDEGISLLLNRSYQFLAPRYMPVTEWESLTQPGRRKRAASREMLW